MKSSSSKDEQCVEIVQDASGWHFYQCTRKRGHGPDGKYCKQHGKKHDARLLQRD